MPAKCLTKEEESRLIDSAIAGDEEAWAQLYQSFIVPLRGFIAGRIGSIEDAEDLTHECFIRAKRTIDEGRYDKRYRFYTLLRGIAVHLAQDFWRARTRHEEGLVGFTDLNKEQQKAAATTFYPQERLELLRLVCMCLAKPHQIIAFVFVKLLEWRPREMVKERLKESLYQLWDEFIETYSEALSEFVSKKTIRYSYCSSLTTKLDLLIDQVYMEHEYKRLLSDYGGPVGNLTMDPFSGQDPAANISDWCDRVKTRTRKLLHSANIESKHDWL